MPQTINYSNSWRAEIIKECDAATSAAGSTVFLNYSTDGVACETKQSFDQICDYLSGKTNQLSYTETNHNTNNAWYQTSGGSSPASFGNNVFDPWLLQMAEGLPREIIRVSDYGSDTLVLAFASSHVARAVLDLDPNDPGNVLVS